MNNSTFTGNTSLGTGGGIGAYNTTDLTINQSTISANTAAASPGATTGGGGGIYLYGSDLTLSGSIVSGNTNDDPSVTVGADIESNQHGYLYLRSASSILGHYPAGDLDDLGGNIISSNPGLYALADNGGSTFTMEPAAGSHVIDAGPLTWTAFMGDGSDQRGGAFLRVHNGQADMGALEVQPEPAPPTTTTTTGSNDVTTTVAPDPVVPAFTG